MADDWQDTNYMKILLARIINLCLDISCKQISGDFRLIFPLEW